LRVKVRLPNWQLSDLLRPTCEGRYIPFSTLKPAKCGCGRDHRRQGHPGFMAGTGENRRRRRVCGVEQTPETLDQPARGGELKKDQTEHNVIVRHFNWTELRVANTAPRHWDKTPFSVCIVGYPAEPEHGEHHCLRASPRPCRMCGESGRRVCG
jgi:hypothetical protein